MQPNESLPSHCPPRHIIISSRFKGIQLFIYMDVSFYPITAFTPPHVWRHGSRTSTMPTLLTHNSVNSCQPLPDGRTASCTGAADSARLMGLASAATPVIDDVSRDTRMLSEPLAASPSPSHLHTQHNHAQGLRQATISLGWILLPPPPPASLRRWPGRGERGGWPRRSVWGSRLTGGSQRRQARSRPGP